MVERDLCTFLAAPPDKSLWRIFYINTSQIIITCANTSSTQKSSREAKCIEKKKKRAPKRAQLIEVGAPNPHQLN